MRLTTRLHRCLAEGRTAVGVFASLNSPAAVELLANGTELDFLAVDQQHSNASGSDSGHMLRALQAADPEVTALARIPDHGKYWIEQSLDAGCVGIIVPITESAQQAAALVQKAYYPPIGARSAAGSIRASLYDDYLGRINEHLMLLPQIESADGLAKVEEIVAVEGVSGVLLGPGDLSLSCGWPADTLWSHAPYLAAVERTVAACRAHGKVSAILTGGDGIYRARDMGFAMIGITGDAVHIRTEMVPDFNARAARLRSAKG